MAKRFWSFGNGGFMPRSAGLSGGALVVSSIALALSACSHVNPSDTSQYGKDEKYNKPAQETIFSTDGTLAKMLGIKGGNNNSGAPGVGVNTYLWRATLDTLSFLPLSSADPFGGVIITDWYAPPASPDERFKVTIYILDRQLNAAALKAAVFRQTKDANGNWVDAAVDVKTAQKLEDEILTRARELRLVSSQAEQQKQ
jgi:Domain of unknown function (DUF3576)